MMTIKQQLLKSIYPVFITVSSWLHKNQQILKNNLLINPPVSVFSLNMVSLAGQNISLAQFKGKKILLVNTASNCGYTPQYKELQQLHKKYKERLIIIGFPSNDFKEQEMGSKETIAQFCEKNYGIQFLMAEKCVVKKGVHQHKIFEWLSHQQKNGWNEEAPNWNFCKYLIDENGRLMYFFQSGVPPLSAAITKAIETN